MPETESLSPLLPDKGEEATRHLPDKACERELTLATEEGSTGGKLASLLADLV